MAACQRSSTNDQCHSVSELKVVIDGLKLTIKSMLESERRSHLDAVDRIERVLGYKIRTSELRDQAKKNKIGH